MKHSIGLACLAIVVTLCVHQARSSFSMQSPMAHRSPTVITTVLQKMDHTKVLELWEQTILAKGGRERLHSISNMVVSAQAVYLVPKGKKNQLHREDLFVFPNKYWSYEDYGSDVFGTRMHMLNYDTQMQYVGSPGHPETILEPITGSKRNRDINYLEVSLLLETKWQTPIPVEASTAVIGKKIVDVVRTTINDRRVDFALDRDTHLPISITFYSTLNDKTNISVQRFSNYIEVGGIRVPQTVKLDDGTEERLVIQFNVDYDPDLFIKPPFRGLGGKAWQAKVSK